MKNEKQRVLNYSNRVLNILMSKKFLITLVSLLIVAFIIDVVPMKYLFDCFGIPCVYDIFVARISYDFSEMTKIMNPLWLFIMGFTSFFFERLNKRFYGIKISDIISSKSYTNRLMYIVGITIAVEPFLMEVAIVFRLWYVLCVDFFLILISLFVVFLFILECSSNSNMEQQIRNSVKDMIEQEKKLKEEPLFSKFLKYANYENVEDRELIEDLLIKEVIEHVDKEKAKKNAIFYVWAYDISTVLLKSGRENSKEILEKCFAVSRNVEFKKGILSTLLDEEKPYDYFYNHLLGIVENNDESLKLRYWIVVYELYQSRNMESKWRKVNAQIVFEQYGITAYQDSVEEEMFKLWMELDEDMQNIRIFYEFLDEER